MALSTARVDHYRRELALSPPADPFRLIAELLERQERLEMQVAVLKAQASAALPSRRDNASQEHLGCFRPSVRRAPTARLLIANG